MKEWPKYPANACQVMSVTVLKWVHRGSSEHLSQRNSSTHRVVMLGILRRDRGIGRAQIRRMRASYSPFQA